MKNALLIVNPAAGQGKPANTLGAIHAALGLFLGRVFVTHKAGDAEDAARGAAADGFDAVLVAGGDGTVNEVINGLLSAPNRPKSLPLGLVPLGTQNVLASELGLPSGGDLAPVAALLAGGKTRLLDVGLAGTRYFVLMAGFGFDATVVRDVLRPVKDRFGPAAYAFATLGALAKYRSTEICLTLDGQEVCSEAFLVVIANAASYAARQIKLAPFAAPDDGWLDVCVFERQKADWGLDRVVPQMGFASQMMAVLGRRHLQGPGVRYYRARSIALRSDPPIGGHLDGEAFGMTPVQITVVPRILPVFVP